MDEFQAAVRAEIEMLDDYPTRREGIRRLRSRRAKATDAVPALLVAFLKDPTQTVRMEIIDALGEIAGEGSPLVPAWSVATLAITYLYQADTEDKTFGPAVTAIKERLQTTKLQIPVGDYVAAILVAALRHEGLRATATKALKRLPNWAIRPWAASAVPALIDSLTS